MNESFSHVRAIRLSLCFLLVEFLLGSAASQPASVHLPARSGQRPSPSVRQGLVCKYRASGRQHGAGVRSNAKPRPQKPVAAQPAGRRGGGGGTVNSTTVARTELSPPCLCGSTGGGSAWQPERGAFAVFHIPLGRGTPARRAARRRTRGRALGGGTG